MEEKYYVIFMEMKKMSESNDRLLVVKNLTKHFPTNQGLVKAVDDVNFSIKKGETLGVVGESGSGKTTMGYVIIGIYSPTSGDIYFDGKLLQGRSEKRSIDLKKEIGIVFQDPGGSLNPRRNIKEILTVPLKIHNLVKDGDYESKVLEIFNMIGLSEDYLDRYPRTLGGRERQLVAVARSLATNPRFIILDEPTSALDVSVQGTIINTLQRLQKNLHLTYLFITHDLILMRNVADRIMIMYSGKICEMGETAEFFSNPLHPYTQMLLSSIPVLSEEEEKLKPKKVPSRGEIPNPVNLPSGCYFHPRCSESKDICKKVMPEMIKIDKEHFVRCHLVTT